MRNHYSVRSSEIYHLNPEQIRSLGLELSKKSEDDCYGSKKSWSQEERRQEYGKLREKIDNEGFSEEHPIEIMLNRKEGSKDKILDGHHRLAIAIELGIELVPVRFVW